MQSVHWPSSVQAAFHLVDSTTDVPSADGLPTIVFGRMSRAPLVPPPPGLLPLPPAVNAIARPFHSLCRCMASGRPSYPPVVCSMAFSVRAVALPPSPAPPPHHLLWTVSAERPWHCSASGCVGDHDMWALSLTRPLWEPAYKPSFSLACASLFLLGGSFYFSWGFSVSVCTRLGLCVEARVCRSEYRE